MIGGLICEVALSRDDYFHVDGYKKRCTISQLAAGKGPNLAGYGWDVELPSDIVLCGWHASLRLPGVPIIIL